MDPSGSELIVSKENELEPASDLVIEELEERIVPLHGACACSTSCSCTSCSCIVWF